MAPVGGKSGNIALHRGRQEHLAVHSRKNQHRPVRAKRNEARCQHVVTQPRRQLCHCIGRRRRNHQRIGPLAQRNMPGKINPRRVRCREHTPKHRLPRHRSQRKFAHEPPSRLRQGNPNLRLRLLQKTHKMRCFIRSNSAAHSQYNPFTLQHITPFNAKTIYP